MNVRVPDERGPTGPAVQTAQVTADGGLFKLLDILQLFLSHVRPLSHEQLHEVKQLLHRLHKDGQHSPSSSEGPSKNHTCTCYFLRQDRRGRAYPWVLAGVGREVFKGPLDVLVGRQLAGEGGRLLAAHAQDGVVRRQHAAVEQHHLLVVVIGQDVVEGDVFSDDGVLDDEPHVLAAVHTDVIPEGQKGLFVVVRGDRRL